MQRLAAPADAFLAGAEGAEVLGGSWSCVSVQLHHNPTGGSTADGDIEEDPRVRHFC